MFIIIKNKETIEEKILKKRGVEKKLLKKFNENKCPAPKARGIKAKK